MKVFELIEHLTKAREFMKWFVLVLILSVFYSYAHGFNCGNGNLATEGMHKYQILKDCGKPASSQVVGYNYGRSAIRIVEEWVYITQEYGKRQMYLLKIGGGGIVREIVWLGEVK
jgi:hypothetical protein